MEAEVWRDPGELEEVKPLVGKTFAVSGPEGAINEVKLTLDQVEPYKEYTGDRQDIRRKPYALLFSGPLSPMLVNGLYKLVDDSAADDVGIMVFLRIYDQDEDSGRSLYEVVVN